MKWACSTAIIPYLIRMNAFEESQRLVDLINTQNGNVNNLWSIYTVVLFGFAGFIFANNNARTSKHYPYLIGLFVVFAITNGWVIYKSQYLLYVANVELGKLLTMESFTTAYPAWTTTLAEINPSPAWMIFAFHLFVDALIVFVLFKLRKSEEPEVT